MAKWPLIMKWVTDLSAQHFRRNFVLAIAMKNTEFFAHIAVFRIQQPYSRKQLNDPLLYKCQIISTAYLTRLSRYRKFAYQVKYQLKR